MVRTYSVKLGKPVERRGLTKEQMMNCVSADDILDGPQLVYLRLGHIVQRCRRKDPYVS